MHRSAGALDGVAHGTPPHIAAVLLDFFNTVAIRRPVDDWISDAEARAGLLDAASRAEVRARLPDVWSKARTMFPDLNWDLDPASHRETFIVVVSNSNIVSVDFAAALHDVMPQQVALNKGVSDFLHTVHERGLKLAVVSNTALDIRPVLREWGIAQLLDAVTLSFEVGCVKPDPRIFRLTAEALQVDPTRCLMIGDSEIEDGGAARAGMQCVISEPAQMWRAFEHVTSFLSA